MTRMGRSPLLLCALLLAVLFTACSSRPAADSDFSVLTLNLHTYQELQSEGVAESELTDLLAMERVERYGPIFDRIAFAINELDPDVVCLQEVGEWSGGNLSNPELVEFGTTDSNMVRQVLQRVDSDYYVTMDWSHYGFDVWLEGSAILSKYPFVSTDSRYISRPENSRYSFWKARKVPMAMLDAPGPGYINVFSVHTGWWDDEEEPFQEQYGRLLSWVGEFDTPGSTTVLCGDFNMLAGSEMQPFMTEGTGYSDQYALANPQNPRGVANRIDYILVNDDSPFEVTAASIVFTAESYGIVSDHTGVFARLRRQADDSGR